MIHDIFTRHLFSFLGAYICIQTVMMHQLFGGDAEVAASISYRRKLSGSHQNEGKKSGETAQRRRQEKRSISPSNDDSQHIGQYVVTQYVCNCCAVS